MGKITHGYAKGDKTRTYIIWQNMRARCNNINNPRYTDYGGNGIKVCAEWNNDFTIFLTDMGEAPVDKTLERLKNELGYTKNNCKWADRYEQAQNRSGWGKSKASLGIGYDSKNKKWRARIKRGGVNYFIGNFASEVEAIQAKLDFIEETGL